MVVNVRCNMLTKCYDHTSHGAERREVSTGGKSTVLPRKGGGLALGYWRDILGKEGEK